MPAFSVQNDKKKGKRLTKRQKKIILEAFASAGSVKKPAEKPKKPSKNVGKDGVKS